MTNDYWSVQVLEKLRHAVLTGSLAHAIKWQYDDDNTIVHENAALMAFGTLGVVEVSVIDPQAPDPFYLNDSGVYISDDHSHIVAYQMKAPEGIAILSNISPERYEATCFEFGLDPHKETFRASLELIGIGKPVITIGKQRYEFASLHTDSYKEKFLSYLIRHPSSHLVIESLNKEKGFQSVTNLNELVENSYLSKELSPFIQITKDSVTFSPEAQLTKEQVEAIKARSKS